jgi:hypothetical protein
MNVPSGTPVTSATVSPGNVMAIALAAFFPRHWAHSNGRANREEHTARQPLEHAGGNQRFLTGACHASRLPSVNSAISPSSSALRGSRQLARERGEHRRANGDAQCIKADQQAGRGKTDAQISSNNGDEANDDEPPSSRWRRR